MPLRIPILAVLMWTMLFAGAQSKYHFSTLGMEQGLSSNFAWSIGQDKYGFMWIGTANGLNRYDGHNIRQYFHDDADSFSIPGNVVYWIFTDKDGDMWLACGHQGLVKYNYAKDRFEKLPQYEAIRKNFRFRAPVWRVYNDLQGRIYLACGGSLFRYTKSTAQFENLTPLFHGAIDNEGVSMVLPQSKDQLWVLVDGGLFSYNLLQNTIRPVPFDVEGMGRGAVGMRDAEFVNGEEMLISMERAAFVFFNTRTWTFRPAPKPFDPVSSKNYTGTGGVVKDRKGRIWLANSFFGLVEYKPATNSTYTLKHERSYPYPYPEQEGRGMNVFEDRDGNIWYGTSQKGVVWFQPDQDFIKVYQRNYAYGGSLPDDAVYGFLPSPLDTAVYIGNGKGLTRLNKKEGEFFNYPRSFSPTDNYPSGVVRSFQTLGDTIVMSTSDGLSFLNQRSGAFSRYLLKNELHRQPYELFTNNLISAHAVAPDELILLGGEGTAARFDLKTGRCFSKEEGDKSDSLYTFANLRCGAYDGGRRLLWLAGGTGELHSYDVTAKKSRRHLFGPAVAVKTITAIQVTPKGDLWLATDAGLLQYDPSTQKSRLYTLPAVTQACINVAMGPDGAVWATTGNEVVKLDPASGKMLAYNLNAQVPYIAVNPRSMFIAADSNAWIGSEKGFCVVENKTFLPKTYNPAPHLVNFNVFDRPKLFGQPYYDLRDIDLAYNENFFSFTFSALDYNGDAGLQYAYRLTPFDKDWIITDKSAASYTNVPPGDYRLLLRTQRGPGQWTEAQPIAVHVGAPVWQRWWFISLAALAVAFGTYFLYRLRQRRKTERRMNETVDYFANSLYGENSINEICWDIARNCIAQLKLEDCVVYLLDEKRNVLVQRAAYGPKNPKDHEIINPLDLKIGEGIVGTAAQTGKPILIKDTSKDGRYVVDDAQRLSEVAVPIVHEGKVLGVIDSEHSRRNYFDEEHLKVLSTIAAITASKIAEAKAEAAARQSEMQLLEIKKLYAESQLMALRAQMNPHFVFNCLNSIQECIVTQKYGEASLYLNKFAKLFRSVLNNSGKVMVTLAEEIEVLDLYLTLEYMRFEHSFQYIIDVEEDLESEEILVPSMLLQPYVENALWHGLMHKPADRHLTISFRKKSSEVFECVIEDNGIGRQKALELKQQQQKTKRHVSRGMTISKDRLDLLQKQGQHAVLTIVDKYHPNGEAAGTKVVVELSSFLE